MVIDVISFIMYAAIKKEPTIKHTESVELFCSFDNNVYMIEVGSDGYFNCSNCSKELQKEIKDNYIDYKDISKTEKSISSYFKNNNGSCEE